MVNQACSAISWPWSQVSDRVSCRGSVVIAAARASATNSARCPSGSPTSIRYRVDRSTSVLPVPARYRPSRVRRGTDGIRIVCGLSTSGTAAVVGQRDSGRVVFLPQWLGIPDDATGYVFVDGAPQPSLTVDLFGARV